MDILFTPAHKNFCEELRDITSRARTDKAKKAIPGIETKMRQAAQDGKNEYYVSSVDFDINFLQYYFETQGFTVKVYSKYSLNIAW